MLFNYQYKEYSIERFQIYLDHLVKKVWCQPKGKFSLNKLHPDLQAIIKEISYDGSIGDWLHGPIKKIYSIFSRDLTAAQRKRIAKWYDNNNSIKALCARDPRKLPATYKDIKAINEDLEVSLKAFCKSLFTDVIKLKAVTSRIGTLDDHYDNAFLKHNKKGKCPYCGFGDILGQYHSKREAYDHYLPKGTYPFNSVNFKNLAPMCHTCNSSYKLAQDPTYHIDPLHKSGGGVRRKAFYSYATTASGIAIGVTLDKANISKLGSGAINFQITAPGRTEEVETWKEIFGIEERYRSKCCAENDGKVWLERILIHHTKYKRTKRQMLAAEIATAEADPWSDANFLKKPFLLACKNAGII
jgi:hypothetical protein